MNLLVFGKLRFDQLPPHGERLRTWQNQADDAVPVDQWLKGFDKLNPNGVVATRTGIDIAHHCHFYRAASRIRRMLSSKYTRLARSELKVASIDGTGGMTPKPGDTVLGLSNNSSTECANRCVPLTCKCFTGAKSRRGPIGTETSIPTKLRGWVLLKLVRLKYALTATSVNHCRMPSCKPRSLFINCPAVTSA